MHQLLYTRNFNFCYPELCESLRFRRRVEELDYRRVRFLLVPTSYAEQVAPDKELCFTKCDSVVLLVCQKDLSVFYKKEWNMFFFLSMDNSEILQL